jgi:transposase
VTEQEQEENMRKRFHGIDRHTKSSTVSVLDREGHEERFIKSCKMEEYVKQLGSEDAVIIEASCGSFYWADRIEETGAQCFVLDPKRFRIITDSWNKTDKQDARNMAKALWVSMVSGEFGVPTVYKPSEAIRTLRRLFATYQQLNRQIRMVKNATQAMLRDDGITLSKSQRTRLWKAKEPVAQIVGECKLSEAIEGTLQVQVDLLGQLIEAKRKVTEQIVKASAPLSDQIELLITIPGITPLSAAAFLADVGDITRFSSQRRMSSYLGLVPRCHDSGEIHRQGHINRESRTLTRTMLTQSIYLTVKGTPEWQLRYEELKSQRGSGRARIAMIRKLCGVMRRMLLNGEEYHWLKEELYQRKLRSYRKILNKLENKLEREQKTA